MSIKENLQKILDAVYGKDVRQAIHDSIEQGIEQCEEKTNIAINTVKSLLDNLISTVQFSVLDGKYWDFIRGDIHESSNAYAQSVKIPANPGETYKIRCHKGDPGTLYITYPILAVSGLSGTTDDMLYKGMCENPLVESEEIYVYTVPSGSDGLIINHVRQSGEFNFDIEIYKLRV